MTQEKKPKTDDKKHKPKSGQIDPSSLSGEQEQPDKSRAERRREDKELKEQEDRLKVFQRNTYPQVEQILTEALSCMLPMGWSIGAVINDEGMPEFKILPLSLAQYQQVKKEKLRAELSGKA